MSKLIEEILSEVLKSEGGYVNDPKDRGGPTNMGITQTTLSEWRGRPATIADVKALKKDEALAIYRKRFIADPKFDKLPEPLQPVVIDIGVNSGPGRGWQLLCRAMNAMRGITGKVEESMVYHPSITEAAGDLDSHDLVNKICDVRDQFYRDIVAAKPSQKKYIKGWLNRSKRFRV